VTVSYWLNRLQHLPAEAPEMFVTLNPPQPPAADTIIRKLQLAHPVYRWAVGVPSLKCCSSACTAVAPHMCCSRKLHTLEFKPAAA
jgi:predicted NAD/FAD-binding protein